jgi:putative ATP-binding cassette transporter
MLRGETRGSASPVSSMRSLWGLMRAYWFSKSWRESWGLTFAILVLTPLSAQASVWFAVTSGELINRIAYLHHSTTPTTPTALSTTAATLAAIAIIRDVCFTAVRHFFSTILHRKLRQWLDRRFNEALLDGNHTHSIFSNSDPTRPDRLPPPLTMSSNAFRNRSRA